MTMFRFAPSPNGRLHLGHAFSALLNARLAQRLRGRFLLRLEDIDPTRCTKALAEAAMADLRRIGLIWEEPVRVQSEHKADYAAALGRLRERGLIYPCFCSRGEIIKRAAAADPDGAPLYDGYCAALSAGDVDGRMAKGEPHSWRLHMARALAAQPGPHYYTRFALPGLLQEQVKAEPARWGDAILARKETPTSYHLSVVVDDALQAITHVVRGRDLEAATCLHVLLQALLGLPTPLYHHHALLTTPEGDKLSKSKGCEALADLWARGMTGEDVLVMLEPQLPL